MRETLRDALRSSKRDSAILARALIERAYAYLGERKKAQAKKDAEKVMAQDRSHPLLSELMAAIDPDSGNVPSSPQPNAPDEGPNWGPPTVSA